MLTPLRFNASPIKFGTDGWRGVLGVDITLERLMQVATASAQELRYRAPANLISREVVIGYDRRFLAPELAMAICSAVSGCDLEPVFSETSVTTPACSWAVVQRKALGALVITASHNPPEWIGLKIKGPFGGSVDGDFTKAVEKRISTGIIVVPKSENRRCINIRQEHLDCLKAKFDLQFISRTFKEIGLNVIVDPMHGSASGCLKDIFKDCGNDFLTEIRMDRDPLFDGNPPEPLAKYLEKLIDTVHNSNAQVKPSIGIVFDGDGDRIAAIDEFGNYCSTQLIMPLLIDHLIKTRDSPGSIIKTVSGSDLMRLVAEESGREVKEFPVGFKYIASEMLSSEVLIGGEESGGLGFGMHLPERDALFTAILILETLAINRKSLGACLKELTSRFGKSYYDRIDLRLENMSHRNKLEELLKQTPLKIVAGKTVKNIDEVDGIKIRLDKFFWLMFRFSGTEPLLRIYCEAPTSDLLKETLDWARNFAEKNE